MIEIKTKNDLLNKLRSYVKTPDDESVRYKEIIKHSLLKSPELLYALHEESLEPELFCENEAGEMVLNIDEDTGELLGEVDLYFGENANIRPYLFIPETQDKVRNYICYQVMFDEIPKYNNIQKYTEIKFTIFANGSDRVDDLTGIARHDLIASIIREKFNWSSIFGLQTKLISSKESTTDNNYLVRTLIFQILDTNGIGYTPYGEETYIRNNEYWV